MFSHRLLYGLAFPESQDLGPPAGPATTGHSQGNLLFHNAHYSIKVHSPLPLTQIAPS